MSTNVEGQFVSPNDAKPLVVRSAYYTPTMNEFYIGADFEWHTGDFNWVKSTITDFDAPMIGSTDGGEHPFEYALSDGRIRIKGLDNEDFIAIGCVLQIERCPFYGTKNVYKLDGVKQSEQGWSDGFDTTYFIEPVVYRDIEGNSKYGVVKIIKIDVGGFAGGETKEQIFHGVIKNKSELIRTLRQLGCVQS